MRIAELKGCPTLRGQPTRLSARMEGRHKSVGMEFTRCVTSATSRLPPKWRYTCKGSSNLRAVQLYEAISLVAVNVS